MGRRSVSKWHGYVCLALATVLTACGGVGKSITEDELIAAGGGSAASCTPTVLPAPVVAATDGSAGAPVGVNPLFPNLFQASCYKVRPAWLVAGVDYGVGIPSATVLKDPATIVMAGVTVSTATHVVSVDANNITLDAYDFSLAGGWEIKIGSAVKSDSTRITNSRFKVGANALPPIFGTSGATNLYVGNCEFDGDFNSDHFNGTGITMDGAGLTAEYNLMKNNYGGGIDVGGGGTIIVRFNVFDNLGQGSNTRGFLLQIGGGTYTVTAIYNMLYQPMATLGSGTNGFQIVGDSSNAVSITAAEVGNNSMIALAGAKMQFMVSVSTSQLAGAATIHDNYGDISGATVFGEAGSSGGGSSFTNNLNLVSGLAFPTNP